MTTTTSHITPDTRLIARSGAAEGELLTGRQRPGDEGPESPEIRIVPADDVEVHDAELVEGPAS
jgi:hypothetical protein